MLSMIDDSILAMFLGQRWTLLVLDGNIFCGKVNDGGLNDDEIEEDDEIEVDHLVGVEPSVAHLVDVTAPGWALPFLTEPFWTE